MNALDKAISFISPRWGYERRKYRHYEAAAFGRRTKSFDKARSTGPNLEISSALVTLRNRSRFFVRNNGWAKRAIEAITNNTVGEGIRPAPVGTKNQVKKVKKLWKDWAESTACDWYGKNTFYGLQSLAMREIAEGGEVIVVKRKVKPTLENPIPIQIQIIEGDQLDHTKDSVSKDGGYIRLGVEYESNGKVKGYWVYDQHPTDGTGNYMKLDSSFIRKEDCLHVYELLRIGQIRGVPMGVASFIKLSDFSDYEDAQLMRQKVAACFAAFVTGDETDSSLTERIEPGIIQHLAQGETVTFASPPTTQDYDPYTTKILQGIAASYGITYEMLTMDYSKVNFSSGRMAQINVIANFKKWQYNMLVPQLCVPVWNWFIEGAMVAGLTTVRISCSSTDWTAPRIQQLDPVKETNARVLQIQAGLTTLSEIIREDGRDPEEFFEEIKTEREQLKLLGINLSSIVVDPEPEPNNKNDGNTQGN
jgi:lambda family phage portal protein